MHVYTYVVANVMVVLIIALVHAYIFSNITHYNPCCTDCAVIEHCQ